MLFWPSPGWTVMLGPQTQGITGTTPIHYTAPRVSNLLCAAGSRSVLARPCFRSGTRVRLKTVMCSALNPH